jgi:hypothetical protein
MSVVLEVIPKLNITIEQYSEKCIAVFGDTQNCKDTLTQLGGKFNPMLKGLNDTKRPGWVFVKNNDIRAKILQALQQPQQASNNNNSSSISLSSNSSSTSSTSSKSSSSSTDDLMKIVQQLCKRLDSVETELFAVRKILHSIQTPAATNQVIHKDNNVNDDMMDDDEICDYDEDDDCQQQNKKSNTSSTTTQFVSLIKKSNKK